MDPTATTYSGGLNDLANSPMQQKKKDVAEILFKRAIDDHSRIAGADNMDTLWAAANIPSPPHAIPSANLCTRDDEALDLADRFYKSLVCQLGPDDLQTCNTANELGDSLMYTEIFDEAEKLQFKTLRHVERVGGRDRPKHMGGTFSLAHIHREWNRIVEAIEMFDKTLARG
ncbi:MAG: hypothetical protein Q9201_007252 [Fulgogasparrea decipioides]